MTMMIMRFHRLIQSRLLWIFFLGIVVVTFVFWGVADSFAENPVSAQLKEPVAHLDGKAITFGEYDTQRRMLERFQGERIPREELEDLVFTRVAMLRKAKDLGLHVPESQAKREYARNFLNEKGEYDEQARLVFRDSLRRDALQESDVLRYLTDEMVLQQLQRVLASHALVPPFDVERWAGQQTDRFELDYALVPPSLVTNAVVVSETQLQDFFAKFRENFRQDEQRQVKYVAVQIPDWSTETNRVSATDAEAYYHANPEKFSVKIAGTNGTERVEAIPLAEVRGNIVAQLIREQAQAHAQESAMSLAVKLTPRRGRAAPTLEVLAASMGLNVSTSALFTANTYVDNIEEPVGFAKAAFELDLTPTGRVSQPVLGRTEAYVLQLDKIEPPRLPELPEVAAVVSMSATNYYTSVATVTLASNLVAELKGLVSATNSFIQAAQGMGLVATSAPPFQLREVNNMNMRFPVALAQNATSHGVGEVFGPLQGPFGQSMIGFLRSRTPQPEDAAAMIPELRNFIGSDIQMRGFFARFRDDQLLADLKKVRVEEPADDAETAEAK
jgi:hypothetical protein